MNTTEATLLSATDAAAVLNVTHGRLRELRLEGRIDVTPIGHGRHGYRASDVERLRKELGR